MKSTGWSDIGDLISRYRQEHGVHLAGYLECAADTGKVQEFRDALHDALTRGQPMTSLEDFGARLYSRSPQETTVLGMAVA